MVSDLRFDTGLGRRCRVSCTKAIDRLPYGCFDGKQPRQSGHWVVDLDGRLQGVGWTAHSAVQREIATSNGIVNGSATENSSPSLHAHRRITSSWPDPQRLVRTADQAVSRENAEIGWPA